MELSRLSKNRCRCEQGSTRHAAEEKMVDSDLLTLFTRLWYQCAHKWTLIFPFPGEIFLSESNFQNTVLQTN